MLKIANPHQNFPAVGLHPFTVPEGLFVRRQGAACGIVTRLTVGIGILASRMELRQPLLLRATFCFLAYLQRAEAIME